uniref:Glycosyl transferase family 25 domain-containing protein n=1 Tax=viral metagenome TaxID=1070528 RepID=A0A6C0AP78_9ZZZZ
MQDLTDTKLYYINLDNRPDRRKMFEGQLALAAMPPVERISAIHGLSVDIKKDKRVGMNARVQVVTEYRRSHYEIHSRGAIGASLSHLKVWQAFLKSGAKYALIMEDDAQLPPTFAMMVRDCAKDLPLKWDTWILGWSHTPVDTGKEASPFKRILHFIGAHCYIITRKAAQAFVDEALPIETHVEHFMNNVAFLRGLVIVRDIRLHLPQVDRVLNISDVRKPEGCPTCLIDDKQEAMEARRNNMQ